MAKSNPPVQSIDRLFDIIEILSASSGGMLLTELSAASGLHVSTAHRLLNSLVDRGYAYKDSGTGKYKLTLRFFEIGCQASRALDIISVCRPFLDALSDFAQETVHLVKRDGVYVIYLYKSEPSQMLVRMASHVGGSSPLYCTAVGKAILSRLDDKEVESVWNASTIRRITANTIVDLPSLKLQLADIRQKGYAVDQEENEIGVCCVAAPILDWQGVPIAAASVSGHVSRMTPETQQRILPKLLDTTSAISRQLGCNLPSGAAG